MMAVRVHLLLLRRLTQHHRQYDFRQYSHHDSGRPGGAGIYFFGTPTLFEIKNSTIAMNNSASSGGAILFTAAYGNALIQNTTITANDAANANAGQGGGGIATFGGGISIDLQNWIVSGNTAVAQANSPDVLSAYGSLSNSAIGDTYGFSYSSFGVNLIGQALLLGPLANNGGPTLTIAPQPGSPLIDAGDDSLVPFGLTTDQRGGTVDRFFGTVDIGSFEVQPPKVTIEQDNAQTDPTNVGPIVFDVSFNIPVTGFSDSDVDLSGSTGVGSPTASVVAISSTEYQVIVTGMNGEGTVVASIPADSAFDGSGAGNEASTSIDNSVAFDNVSPTVSIDLAPGQANTINGRTRPVGGI